MNQNYVKALEQELESLVARGLTDRANQVRQELSRFGSNHLSTDGGLPIPDRLNTSLEEKPVAKKTPEKKPTKRKR
jgi:hypothetical protein